MSLEVNSMTFIQCPDTTQTAVAKAAEEWQKFIALDAETKELFAASDLHVGVGYERKQADGTRESHDRKENFDITLDGLRDLKESPRAGLVMPFLSACERLLAALDEPTKQFVKEVPVNNFSAMVQKSSKNRFIRFLYYPPVPADTVIGEAHTDHSGYTFHLYESTGGCHGLSPQNDRAWKDMPVLPNQMVAFAGMQLQLVSEGRIKALCHEITANETTESVGRYAIVCFNLLADVPRYDRATQGRLQDKPAGFNYDMELTEFKQLFA